MKVKIEGLELDKVNPNNFGGMCSRATVNFQRAEGKTINDGIDTIATTDAPAVVIDWTRWERIREILPMRYCEKPVNDKAPLLDAHMRYSIDDVLGSAKNWATTEHELPCKIFVSEAEKDVRTKIDDGTIDSVSIGYQTKSDCTVEIPKNAVVTIDGVEYKNDFEDDLPLVVRTWWKVKELSLVPIGADEAAKIKRAMETGIKAEDPEFQKILNAIMLGQKNLEGKINSITIQKEANVAEPTAKTPEEIRRESCEEIEKTKGMFNGQFKNLADQTILEIKSGKDINVQDFYKKLYDEVQKNGGAVQTPVSYKNFSAKEAAEYSPSRAVGVILRGEERKGLEFEVSDDIARDSGQASSEKGFFLASNFQARALNSLSQRAHSAGTPAEGGYFVTDDFRPDLLKEVTRNETCLGQAGSTIITGLNGPLVVPKIVTGLTSYNVAENINVSKSYIVVDTDEVSPKRISTATELGREQFIRTNKGLPGLDQILIKELYGSQNVMLDYEGINGTGLSNRPTGILNMTGMSSPSLSAVNLQRLVNFKRKVAKANGLKQNMKWLNSVDVESLFEITPRLPGSTSDRTLFENGQVLNYPAISSNQVPDAVSMFGLWSEFYTLLWGVEELIVADQPKHLYWMVEFSLHRLANFYLRSSESFAIADDVPVESWDDLDA